MHFRPFDLIWIPPRPLEKRDRNGLPQRRYRRIAQHTKAIDMLLAHSICCDHPGNDLYSLRVILHVISLSLGQASRPTVSDL